MIGTLIDGKYQVVRMLGSGGMATVYEGRHAATGRRVAIKLITSKAGQAEQLVARFQREARAAGAIDSEHIVQILDAGRDDKSGFPFLVMELLEGDDLERLVARHGPLPPSLALRILAQACLGVQKAHDAGVVHRDLKPANIFAANRDEGRVVIKVLDFGIAKIAEPMALPVSSLTGTNSLLGSPLYMSPEQARGFKDIDHRTDVFSLGVVLYAMLTGKVPHADVGAIGELIFAICGTPAKRVEEVAPWVPPEIGAIVHRALHIERADRYQTVAAMHEAIRPLVGGDSALLRSMFVGVAGPRTESVISSDPEKQRDSFTLGDTGLSGENPRTPAPMDSPAASPDAAPPEPRLTLQRTSESNLGRTGAAGAKRPEDAVSVASSPAPRSSPPGSGQETAPGAAKDASLGTTGTTPRRASTGLALGVTAAVVIGGLVGWDLWARSHAKHAGLLPAPSASASVHAVKDTIDDDVLRSFSPLPAVVTSAKNPLNEDKIALGRLLFYDPRLSKAHDVSCASCHSLEKHGVDGLRFSTGHAHMQGTRNALTVYNSAGFFALMWDGRFENVEKQASGPIASAVEMAQNPGKIEAVLRSIPGYVALFAKAFPGEKAPLSFENATRAIGAFERKLLTPGRWDRFLQGDRSALTSAERAGFNTFVDVGCVQCHSGTYVGASSFQKLGLVKAWGETRDRGRFEVTKEESDFMVFRVPRLRNVAMTAPYFHDGAISSLDEAVRLMGRHQIGKELTPQQVSSIVTWLRALTGELPLEYARKPEPFPSGPTTPKPATD